MHLGGSIKEGFDWEKLAGFILSEFSYISQPISVPDDIGADFICNPFEIFNKGGKKFIMPINSAFYIQIKKKTWDKGAKKTLNKDKEIPIKNHISRLFCSAWLPFFVGIIDRRTMSLTFYSGRHLASFYHCYGDPLDDLENKVKVLLKEDDGAPSYSKEENIYKITFPKIAVLNATNENEMKAEWKKVLVEIQEIQSTIAEQRYYILLSNIRNLEPDPKFVAYFRKSVWWREIGEFRSKWEKHHLSKPPLSPPHISKPNQP